ncbi:MAG TPA: dihydroorotase family protein [bacterium]|nr:dihydroorotase family protein [bacterium]
MTAQRVPAAFDVIVAGADVVTPSAVRRLDIGVRDGLIDALGAPGTLGQAARVIDAAGKVVLPGVIDPHVHCRIHSHHVDDLPTVLEAAAAGGVTTALVHLLPSAPAAPTPRDLLEEFRDLGRREAPIDFSFHAWLPERAGTLEQIPELLAAGVPSFKLFCAYKSIGRMASDAFLVRAMDTIGRRGGMLLVHAEDGELIEARIAAQRARGRIGPSDYRWTHPDEAEWIAVAKTLGYARATGCPLYVVHVSTPRGIDLIEDARLEGQRVWAETCVQYLELTDEALTRWGPLAKISPPLRDTAAQEGLWRRVAAGRIDALGSDHSPHSRETKAPGYRDIFDAWYGAPGVQTLLPVMWDAFRRRALPLPLLARVLSEAPARIFGLERKGAIAPGLDADLAIMDPGREVELRSEEQIGGSGYTLYEGRRVRGWPVTTLRRGEVLVDGGVLRRRRGGGRFLARRPAS